MLNRHLQVLKARGRQFEQVFVTVERRRFSAMVVTSDTMFSNESATLGRTTAPSYSAYHGSLSRLRAQAG